MTVSLAQDASFGIPSRKQQAVKTIMHVDLDAFYASVETINCPQYATQPMFVAGEGRGVVLSANYLARKFGIKSGMPTGKATRLCPRAIVVAPNFDWYNKVSEGVFCILAQISDKVEQLSIDEGFLDITGAIHRLGSPEKIAATVRKKIFSEQRITSSVGIGPNKLIAKMATNQAKPNGVVQIFPGQVKDFLAPLPVEKLWGVGPATKARLNQLGIYSIGQLAEVPPATLARAFGPIQGVWLHRRAMGVEESTVGPGIENEEKSVSASRTFPLDITEQKVIQTQLLRLCVIVARKLRTIKKLGFNIGLVVRFADYSTISKSVTVKNPTDVTDEIYATVLEILAKWRLQRARIRLVGVRVAKLVDATSAYRQPMLGQEENKMRQVEKIVDMCGGKFGKEVVKRASLIRIKH